MSDAATEIDIALAPAQQTHGMRWSRLCLTCVLWATAIGVTIAYDPQLIAGWWGLTEGSQTAWFTATILTQIIKLHTMTLLTVLLSVLDRRIRWGLFYNACWIMAVQALASTILKNLFGRLRPDVTGWTTVFYGPTLEHAPLGFPSGHATAAFALAAIFSSYYPRWRWLLLLAAVAVACSRVHLGRHFFGDTVAGAALGWYLASWLLHVLRRAEASRRSPAPAVVPESPLPIA